MEEAMIHVQTVTGGQTNSPSPLLSTTDSDSYSGILNRQLSCVSSLTRFR